MLSGLPPFNAPEPKIMFKKIKEGKVTFSHKEFKKVNEKSKQLIRRMLDPNPKTRITIRELCIEEMFARDDSLSSDFVLIKNKLISNLRNYRTETNFMKAIKYFIAYALKSNIQNYDTINNFLMSKDADMSGRIDKEEFTKLLIITLGMDPKEVDPIWKAINMNGDDTVEFTEFIAATASFKSVDCAKMVWSRMDDNSSNDVSFNEFSKFMKDFNIDTISEDKMMDIFISIDDDKNNKLTLAEFERYFEKEFNK